MGKTNNLFFLFWVAKAAHIIVFILQIKKTKFIAKTHIIVALLYI